MQCTLLEGILLWLWPSCVSRTDGRCNMLLEGMPCSLQVPAGTCRRAHLLSGLQASLGAADDLTLGLGSSCIKVSVHCGQGLLWDAIGEAVELSCTNIQEGRSRVGLTSKVQVKRKAHCAVARGSSINLAQLTICA